MPPCIETWRTENDQVGLQKRGDAEDLVINAPLANVLDDFTVPHQRRPHGIMQHCTDDTLGCARRRCRTCDAPAGWDAIGPWASDNVKHVENSVAASRELARDGYRRAAFVLEICRAENMNVSAGVLTRTCLMANREDGRPCILQHFFRDRTKEKLLEARSPVRTEHDQIRLRVIGCSYNLFPGLALAHHAITVVGGAQCGENERA